MSLLDHSRFLGIWDRLVTVRWEAKASHKRKIKSNRATNLIIDPNEDTIFHLVYASG